MKHIKSISTTIFLVLLSFVQVNAQQKPEARPELWTVFNREVRFADGEIYLSAAAKDGILWLNEASFSEGTIELDIKGKDVQGQSFVGVAFHGADNQTFDGVYFRPFNFRSPERKSHSVQYISMPENNWSFLRENFPGKYENEVTPVPEPNEWFHAKIVIEDTFVTVFVNGSDQASLKVEKISRQNNGKIGLWVGNGSDGWFKNFILSSK